MLTILTKQFQRGEAMLRSLTKSFHVAGPLFFRYTMNTIYTCGSNIPESDGAMACLRSNGECNC